MKFFEGARLSVYVQAARLRLDKKTSERHWNLTLAIKMSSALAHSCAEMIVSNFAQISTDENKCGGLDIDAEPPVQRVKVYRLEKDETLSLDLSHWTLTGLRMTKVEKQVELWVTAEHVATDSVWAFVRWAPFTRVWMEFCANASAPDVAPVSEVKGEPAADMAEWTGEVLGALEQVDPAAAKRARASLKRAAKEKL